MRLASPSGFFSVVQPGRVFARPPCLALTAFVPPFPPPKVRPLRDAHSIKDLHSEKQPRVNMGRVQTPAGKQNPPPGSSVAFLKPQRRVGRARRKSRRWNFAASKTYVGSRRFE